MEDDNQMVYPEVARLVAVLRKEAELIPEPRKEVLLQLRAYAADGGALNFICTHNSRRSHLGMIWAAVAAHLSGRSLVTYSGGTEATALNPRMVAALQRAGFRVEDPGGDNPRYRVSFADDVAPLTCFSKRYDDPVNPTAGFAAVMTCSEADENCPFIPGAGARIPLTYEDPKVADDTAKEKERYDERLRQIGRELLWALG